MPRNKPGVDWSQIKREYEAGDSCYEIAKRHPVTKQGILQRKTKEGWELPQLADIDDDGLDRQVKALPSVIHNEDYYGFRTADNAKKLILNRMTGLSLTGCAKLCGAANSNVVQDWRQSDELFDRLMCAAEGHFESKHWGNLTQASERGDVQAIKATLEKSDATQDQYKQEAQKSAGITVIFNNVPKPGTVING